MGVLHKHRNAVWQLRKWQIWPPLLRAHKDRHLGNPSSTKPCVLLTFITSAMSQVRGCSAMGALAL